MTEEKKTEEKQVQGESVTVSKRELRETAAEVEALSDAAAAVGRPYESYGADKAD